MNKLRGAIFAIISLLILNFGQMVPASPTLNITSPTNGALFKTNLVNVTGTSSGTAGQWSQTSQADFDLGTKDNITSTPSGELALVGMFDDFNDNSLNNNLWTCPDTGGMTTSEAAGAIRQSGVSSTAGYWTSRGTLRAKTPVTNEVAADLTSFSGTGSGYYTYLHLDDGVINAVAFGQIHDAPWGAPTISIYLAYRTAAGSRDYPLGVAQPGTHRYSLKFDGSYTYAYEDAVLLQTIQVPFTKPTLTIETAPRASGDTVDAKWDDASCPFSTPGIFVSNIYDTGSDGSLLKNIQWNASLPTGTGISIEVRSSESPDMSAASSWENVQNGQSAGLPAMKRYLQYRATLSSSVPTATPSLKDITFKYYIPIVKVEVSIDGQATWALASGTEEWEKTLALPENDTTLWVRATDSAGQTVLKSIKLDVDTTPPVGSVVINDDAPYTVEREVTLTLHASDRYGVDMMMVSERPDFRDADWMAYEGTLTSTLSGGDGKKTVYVKYKDVNGWESRTTNDSILLDTLPPTGSVVIDEGSALTRNTTVALSLAATDQLGVESMMLGNLADLSDGTWVDVKTACTWDLPPGNGERRVYAKFRDIAGHESRIYNDSIFLDTAHPSVSLKINGGALYSRSVNVTLELQAIENHLTGSMQVAEGSNPSFDIMPWSSFKPSIDLVLGSAEGVKVVTARLQDAAGNIGPSNSSSIILDRTAPVTTIAPLPAVSPRARITVTWSAVEATSGVQWYDVQYRLENGSWTDWQTHTNSTSGVLVGEDLSSYSFRARAQDRAGNLEPFTETVADAVRVQLPEPVVTIIEPAADAKVHGKRAAAQGTCRVIPEGHNVTGVQACIDNGSWEMAEGTLNWTYTFDTTKMKNGLHTLSVRTLDGERQSTQTDRSFRVQNDKPVSVGYQASFYIALIIVVVAIAAVVLALAIRRRPAAAAPPTRYGPAPPGAPQAVAQGAPPPPSSEALREQREIRIKQLLETVSDGLPPELNQLGSEDLAELIAGADEGETPKGELIVKVLDHWYFGDETKPGLFMRRYK